MQNVHSNSSPGFLPAQIGNVPITMSSREIADLCEKRHDHVLRDIERMLLDIADPKFGASDFLSSYTDSTGRSLKEYRLPKDLTITLVTGYRADLRYKVVKKLEEMESVRPVALPTTAEAFASAFTMLAAHEARQAEHGRALQALDAKVDQVAHAHVALDKLPSNCELITYIRRRINKQFGLSEAVVNKVMWDCPYSPTVRVLVKNEHAEGAHNAGYAKKEVSAVFRRFVDECQMVSATMATHPFVEGRFKLTGKAGA
ncbi:Rha family transcriptional regulator [Aquamicrobium sp. NLF2-7]|uniref:Rha family transcriptional regulator n=1 Tax=Aquamicrobium sp. NLF2-7 TaxID=2918753 RepID=UPI001EFA7312|nr:Rha family transcriptional regulator [Aquamicrobium sp. NLF2-7]MCG8271551.1 Rha family transcriptional regulator [Aquamicrobium sp. NLF2-7]